MYQPNRPLKEGCYVTASKEHIALSREAATEGMVLLKNEHNLLPLKAGSRIALFGKGSFDYVKGGGGQRRCDRIVCAQSLRWLSDAPRCRLPLRAAVRFLPRQCERTVRSGFRSRHDDRAGALRRTSRRRQLLHRHGCDRIEPFFRRRLGPLQHRIQRRI